MLLRMLCLRHGVTDVFDTVRVTALLLYLYTPKIGICYWNTGSHIEDAQCLQCLQST